MSITSIDKEFVAGTYGRFPLELVEGKGSIVKDTAGKEYIDLGSGIAVNTFGAPVFIKADNTLTATATGNFLFGTALGTKGTGTGPLEVAPIGYTTQTAAGA